MKRSILLLAAVVSFILPAPAAAARGGVQGTSSECMACHGSGGFFKVFQNQEKMSVFVNISDFRDSVHRSLSCIDCHDKSKGHTHPGRVIESRRAFVNDAASGCRKCHPDEKVESGPNHSIVLRTKGTPPCVDCHGSHKVRPVAVWKSSVPLNTYCLLCHSLALSKTYTSGELLSLKIDPSDISSSVHNRHSCDACHSEYTKTSHPIRKYETGREHAVAVSAICRGCHEDKFRLVSGSIHYNQSLTVGETVIRRGDIRAPVCTDCHGFHAVGPKSLLDTLGGVPCRRCHEDTFRTYEKSVHGAARARGVHTSPICSSCHFAHSIDFAVLSDKIKSACMGCHKTVLDNHKKWLPNTELHLRTVSCVACHAPSAGKGIYLKFFDTATGKVLSEREIASILGTGQAELRDLLNTHGPGADSAGLSYILKKLNEKRAGPGVTYLGRVDATRYSGAHDLALKKNALKECESCHRDQKFVRNITLVTVSADKGAATYGSGPADTGEIGPAWALRNFRLMGSSRVRLLDILGIAMIAGALMFPLMHTAVRVLTARLRTSATHAGAGEAERYIQTLPVRLWHWVHVLAFISLIVTGLEIHFGRFTEVLKFKSAVSLHNICGFLLIADLSIWLVYYVFFANIRIYLPLDLRKFFSGAIRQVRHYGYGIFVGERDPHHISPDSKFNALQQSAYFGVMFFMLPLQIISGVLLWDVGRFSRVIGLCGGIAVVDAVHLMVSYALTAFLIVHVYFTTLGKTPLQHIRAMITGYEKD